MTAPTENPVKRGDFAWRCFVAIVAFAAGFGFAGRCRSPETLPFVTSDGRTWVYFDREWHQLAPVCSRTR